jgi:hypothetical protein
MYGVRQLSPRRRPAAFVSLRRVLVLSASSWSILTLSFLSVMSETTPAQARSAGYGGRAASDATVCALHCTLYNGAISCPNFLTTTAHYQCVDYRTHLTGCGWQLQRVFMCR